MSWRPIGAVSPSELGKARLELHYAAQLVSAPGTTLLPGRADYSHTTLRWDPELDALAGPPVGEQSLRAALVFESLELGVLDGTLERASRALVGSTMREGLDWLARIIAPKRTHLLLPDHQMPEHSLGEGAPFCGVDADARSELAAWFANATSTIKEVTADDPSASEVRCWPHHFDVASLITVDDGRDAEEARSIGVGLSPGDRSHEQPYFYVTPWPYPDPDGLPELSGGARWHTEGWTGAVLTGEQLVSVPAHRQAAVVREALEGAIDACRSLLGA